jgi:hypothetical protein
MCLAPQPEFRRLLEQARDLPIAAFSSLLTWPMVKRDPRRLACAWSDQKFA